VLWDIHAVIKIPRGGAPEKYERAQASGRAWSIAAPAQVWYLPVESAGDVALARREFIMLLIDVAAA
jgi:hypothetical protein